MTRYLLTVLLLISSTVAYSQFIPNDNQKRAILKNYAELQELRGIVRIDSVQIQALTNAYYFKDSAYQAMSQAQKKSDESAQSWHGSYVKTDQDLTTAKKEIRRQKRIKIVAFAVAGLALILR